MGGGRHWNCLLSEAESRLVGVLLAGGERGTRRHREKMHSLMRKAASRVSYVLNSNETCYGGDQCWIYERSARSCCEFRPAQCCTDLHKHLFVVPHSAIQHILNI